MKLIFNRLPSTPPTHAELAASLELLPHEERYKRLVLTFSKPVRLVKRGGRTFTDATTTHTVRLFESTVGKFCYKTASNARSGYYLSDEHLAALISISPEDTSPQIEKVRRLANRFHPNAWADVKARLKATPEQYFDSYGYTVTSIAGKFDEWVLGQIRDSFANKTAFTHDTGCGWRKKKVGRDLRIECRVCEDGIFRAWFSSEFPGCANGDYWMLVNPTTAIFRERD